MHNPVRGEKTSAILLIDDTVILDLAGNMIVFSSKDEKSKFHMEPKTQCSC
jgi:hypothetical protein